MKDKDTSFQIAQDGQINSQSDAEQKIAEVPFTSADADDVNFYLNWFDGFLNSLWNELKTLFSYYGITFNAGVNNQLLGIFTSIETKAEAYQDGYVNGGLITNAGKINIVPVLASNSDQGYTTSASSELIDFEAYLAFNRTSPLVSNYWGTALGSPLPSYLQVQLPIAKSIVSYSIQGVDTPNITQNVKTWTLLGSNTGAFSGEETTLDTQSNITSWASVEIKDFVLGSPSADFLYYRIDITDNNGSVDYTAIGNLFLYSGTDTLVSISEIKKRDRQDLENIDVSAEAEIDTDIDSNYADGNLPSVATREKGIKVWAYKTSGGATSYILSDYLDTGISALESGGGFVGFANKIAVQPSASAILYPVATQDNPSDKNEVINYLASEITWKTTSINETLIFQTAPLPINSLIKARIKCKSISSTNSSDKSWLKDEYNNYIGNWAFEGAGASNIEGTNNYLNNSGDITFYHSGTGGGTTTTVFINAYKVIR